MIPFTRYRSGSVSFEGHLESGGMDTIRDLHRQWQGCVCCINGTNYYIDKVRALDGEVVAIVADLPTANNRYYISFDHPSLSRIYPDLGYFNLHTTSIYIERRIARQWKKGLHDRNIKYSVPYHSLIINSSGGNPFRVVGFNGMRQYGIFGLWGEVGVFDSTHSTPYLEALRKLSTNGALSVALNREMALAVHPLNGEIQLLYHKFHVGTVDASSDDLIVCGEYRWLEETIREVTNHATRS